MAAPHCLLGLPNDFILIEPSFILSFGESAVNVAAFAPLFQAARDGLLGFRNCSVESHRASTEQNSPSAAAQDMKHVRHSLRGTCWGRTASEDSCSLSSTHPQNA